MNQDLTRGNIAGGLVAFALPMIAGDLLQQVYNLTDTLIVGQALGRGALAAVGSAYSLMTFLVSIFLGLSMGTGALFSIYLGRGDRKSLRSVVFQSFALIMGITLLLNLISYAALDPLLGFLQIPREIRGFMRLYLCIIFSGIPATSMANYFSCLLRAAGNSVVPLVFLGISAVLNIALDVLLVMVFPFGIGGAAAATVFAQYVSGVGILAWFLRKYREFLPERADMRLDRKILKEILDLSVLTCAQQSCMNFGILLVQRLVDSFGAVTMAAFAAAVKIDTFAYLPVQDFGNAFSTFVATNYGAGEKERIRRGMRTAVLFSSAFSLVLSILVVFAAEDLMRIFIRADDTAVIASGVRYLRIEGAFYLGIGCLFLWYGFYRAVNRPGISVILTIVSLGLRVTLAYAFSPAWGEAGIWVSIPIGWFLADVTGLGYYLRHRKNLLVFHLSGQ
ncbi:MATE family efflux transporter [Clostridium vitabionis]|uniref:MATE family efflux transporter n=1 Tax=Clostridium vitabionis TaxID=2784388 RepID=UPI00188CCCA6|nr:MATE family efflux transporter [Clostridium vitabionis]